MASPGYDPKLDEEFGNPGDSSGTSSAQDQDHRNKVLGVDNSHSNGKYSEEDAAKRARYDLWANQHGKEGRPDRAHNFYNPGSANYGGRSDGVEFYKGQARIGMTENDAQQASNNAALNKSLLAMKGADARGPMSVENKLLSQRESQSRSVQGDALKYSMAQAMGTAPSAAAFQTRGALNEAMGGYHAGAGAARGLAALSGAQTIGAAGLGGSAGSIGAQGADARAGEIGAGIQSYGAQAGQMVGQDLTRNGMGNQNSQFNRGLNDDWKLGNANLAIGQGRLGVAQSGTDQGWFAESMKPADIQFQLDQEAAAWEAGANADRAAADIGGDVAKRQQTQALVGGITQAGLTAVGSLAGPAGSAAGGLAGTAINSATRKYY